MRKQSRSREKEHDSPLNQNYVITVQIPSFDDQFDLFLSWVAKMKAHLRKFQMNIEQQVDAIISGLSAGTAKEEVGVIVTLSRLKQQPGENLGQFFTRVNAAMEDIEVNEREKEKGIIEVLVKGLRSDIFKRMKDVKIEKRMDAFDMPLEIERNTRKF